MAGTVQKVSELETRFPGSAHCSDSYARFAELSPASSSRIPLVALAAGFSLQKSFAPPEPGRTIPRGAIGAGGRSGNSYRSCGPERGLSRHQGRERIGARWLL